MVKKGHNAQDRAQVLFSVITVSDSRNEVTDRSGRLIRESLVAAGHTEKSYDIMPDDPNRLQVRVKQLCGDVDAVILTGGTGLAMRDTSYEAVDSLLEKKLDGFGELFRMLSFEEVGAAAMLSRAVAGARQRTVIFSLPGSTGAVRLALERLIVPQLGHIVALLRG